MKRIDHRITWLMVVLILVSTSMPLALGKNNPTVTVTQSATTEELVYRTNFVLDQVIRPTDVYSGSIDLSQIQFTPVQVNVSVAPLPHIDPPLPGTGTLTNTNTISNSLSVLPSDDSVINFDVGSLTVEVDLYAIDVTRSNPDVYNSFNVYRILVTGQGSITTNAVIKTAAVATNTINLATVRVTDPAYVYRTIDQKTLGGNKIFIPLLQK
jgi:hypothetical protein